MNSHPLPALTNRSTAGEFQMPADGWFCLVPVGEFPHDKSGLIQVCDSTAIQSMANSFNVGESILVDFDHESWNADKRTTAAGWIENLAARGEGLFGQVKWSRAGLEAVQGGEYRFLSPVWLAADCEDLGNSRVRPRRLADAGLTNRPNLQGIAALSNRTNSISQKPDEVAGLDEPAVAPRKPERPTEAVALFNALTLEIKSKRKLTFELSWEHCRLRNPTAYRNMLRAYADALQPGSVLANKLAAADDQLVPMTCPPAHAAEKFHGLVLAHAEEHECSYEAAFEKVQRSHPFEYGNAMRLQEIEDALHKSHNVSSHL